MKLASGCEVTYHLDADDKVNAIIYCGAGGDVFQLTPVAVVFFDAICEADSVCDAVSTVRSRFSEIEGETVERDLRQFVEDLGAHGILAQDGPSLLP